MSTLICPFCNDTDYDDVGLKAHLSYGECESFRKVEHHPSYFHRAEPFPKPIWLDVLAEKWRIQGGQLEPEGRRVLLDCAEQLELAICRRPTPEAALEPTGDDLIIVNSYPMSVVELLAYADDDSMARIRMAAADKLRDMPEQERLLAKAMEHPGVDVAAQVVKAYEGYPAHPPKPEPTEEPEPNQLEKWAAFVVRTLKAAGPGSLGATGPKDNRHSMVLEILKRYDELPAKQYWKLT